MDPTLNRDALASGPSGERKTPRSLIRSRDVFGHNRGPEVTIDIGLAAALYKYLVTVTEGCRSSTMRLR